MNCLIIKFRSFSFVASSTHQQRQSDDGRRIRPKPPWAEGNRMDTGLTTPFNFLTVETAFRADEE
jgi:hypothetical protein